MSRFNQDILPYNEWKVGDEVRRIAPSPWSLMIQGKIYIINNIIKDDECIEISVIDSDNGFWYIELFEFVRRP